MKTLKRKHARCVTVLMIVTLLFLALPVVMYELAGAGSLLWGILGVSGSTVCLMAMIVVRWKFLQCPYCGRGVARPYWNPGRDHTQFCIKCGQPFIFDDELDGADTTNK